MGHPDNPFLKAISVERLRSLLEGMEPDLVLAANRVGDLVILKGWQMVNVGYIDPAKECIMWRVGKDEWTQEVGR